MERKQNCESMQEETAKQVEGLLKQAEHWKEAIKGASASEDGLNMALCTNGARGG